MSETVLETAQTAEFLVQSKLTSMCLPAQAVGGGSSWDYCRKRSKALEREKALVGTAGGG